MAAVLHKTFFGEGAEVTHMIGGCLCGNLRYAADTELIFSAPSMPRSSRSPRSLDCPRSTASASFPSKGD
jgi:hypothetical protein